MSPQDYLKLIVEPTIAEFEQEPASVRRAFLACTVVHHTIDYISFPKNPRNLRETFGKECAAFATIDRVANAFKHVKSNGAPENVKSNRKLPLKSSNVYSRPPALAGAATAGLSLSGDATGAVLFADEPIESLIVPVREALDFLKRKL